MKKGDKIIWDSGFGYELGYFIGDGSRTVFNTDKVNIVTGDMRGVCMYQKGEVIPCTDENHFAMFSKYGYVLKFPGE